MKIQKISIIVLLCLLLTQLTFAKVGIIVNRNLYPSVQEAISQYITDLKQIDGKDVWLDAESFTETNTKEEMKDAIKDKYYNDNLEGVVLVGDLPICIYTNIGDFFGESATFACDLYYMDLDGVFGAGDIPNSHEGDREPEIWISRITCSVLLNYINNEEEEVNRYFARVHKRMRGLDDMPRKYVVAGDKHEWGYLEQENIGDLGYDPANIDIYEGQCGPQWKAAIVEGREYGYIYAHSWEGGHTIGYDLGEMYETPTNVRFVNSYACSNGNWTTANMVGAYATSGQGLVAIGSSKTGSMCGGTYKSYNVPLGQGKSFGEAFRDWFGTSGLYDRKWHYGMGLQGVGTLRIQPYESISYITVNVPNSGENWEKSSAYSIKWKTNIGGTVKIELLKGSSVVKTIEPSADNSGNYDWEIGSDVDAGNDYKVRVVSNDDNSILGESSDDFTISDEFIITEFPYIQTFDDMAVDNGRLLSENWYQLDNDDMNWIVWTGKTPSKSGSIPNVTGPDGDNTSGSGNYIYVEASENSSPGKKSFIITPKFKLNNLNEPELSFYAHMFSDSNHMGSLNIDIEVDGETHASVIKLKDDHGDEWFQTKLDLSPYKGDRVRFILKGQTGSSWASDICVDDFSVFEPTTSNVAHNVQHIYGLSYSNNRVNFRIPENAKSNDISIKLYSLSGRTIRTIVQGNLKAGYHTVPINSKYNNPLAKGIYLCKMNMEAFTKTISIIVK